MIELFPEREIVFQFGNVVIRWYGVLWALSFWLVWFLAPRLQQYRNLSLSRDEWTRIIAYGAVGALVGGRLGYAVFYEPAYFLQHPFEIFSLAGGGMASHGGFIGVAVGIWLALRKMTIPVLALLDILVVPIAVTLALGRIGNWINQELFIGNFALLAAAKDILIAVLCYLLLRTSLSLKDVVTSPAGKVPLRSRHAAVKAARPARPMTDHASVTATSFSTTNWYAVRGSVTAAFLMLYSILRFFVEFLRDDPWPELWGLTRGQLYTLPLVVLSVWLLVCRVVKNR